MTPKQARTLMLLIVAVSIYGSGVIPAIVPQAVPPANKQGSTGTKFQIASGSTTNGNAGIYDASGNLTDAGAGASPTFGYLTLAAIAAPTAPTVTITCPGTCATNYRYRLVALLPNGKLAPGSTTGNKANAAALDGTHFFTVTATTPVTAASSCDVYRTVAPGQTTGKIGSIDCAGGASLVDNGLVGDGAAFPTSNTTGGIAPAFWQGHTVTDSGTPSIGAGDCGTGPEGTASGNDNAGSVAVGAGLVTTCKVTFGATWVATPHCTIATDADQLVHILSPITTTDFTIAASTPLDLSTIQWTCGGQKQ